MRIPWLHDLHELERRQLSIKLKKNWSEREDLNLRPLAPEASALPGCATLRPTIRTANNLISTFE